MSKIKKDLSGLLSAQQRLFDVQIVEGALDVSLPFRESLSQAIKKSTKSRYGIAADISELTRHNISKDMLDKFTSSNIEYRLSAEDLPGFCAAVGCVDPFRVLLNPLRHEVISPEEGELVRLARIECQLRELQAEAVKIRSRAGIK